MRHVKRGDLDLFVFEDDAGLHVVGVNCKHLPLLQSCRANLDIAAPRFHDVLGHSLDSFRSVNVQLRAAHDPGGEDQVGVSGGVVGMQVGNKSKIQLGWLEGGNALSSRGCRPSNYSWSEIDEISLLSNDDRGGGTRSLWQRAGRACSEKHDLCFRRLVRLETTQSKRGA